VGARDPKQVLVLMGGASGEHPISVRSAATVVGALQRAGHCVTVVGIARNGVWMSDDFVASGLFDRAAAQLVEVDSRSGVPVTLATDGHRVRLIAVAGELPPDVTTIPDVVFPVLHGPRGEDGTIQGLLELLDLPFVGAGCTASALAMDKLALKTMCEGAGIAQVEFFAAGDADADTIASMVDDRFGFPCFVKPANLGSSVGISKVDVATELAPALEEARSWDERVLIEEAVDAREIEIGVLGNAHPRLSPLGEIVAPGGFYDFASKYVDDDAQLIAGASVSPEQRAEIEDITLRVWELTGCKGLARADFFVEKSTGRVLFNELNTIPGFTEISMYPRLWATAGIAVDELTDRLISLAFERHADERSRRREA
jgi:D-alanine-D-alanine ligase